MNKRRKFIKTTVLGGIGASSLISSKRLEQKKFIEFSDSPVIISTWNHGLDANIKAWEELENGKEGIVAVESGVRVSEADPKVRSVGYGGFPDRDGIVSLDACIMDKNSNCGAVSFLQNIKHPISVAKLVMEKTPHVMLSGKGAFDFAIKKSDSEINKEIENAKLVSPVFFSQDTSLFVNNVDSNIYINDPFLKDSILVNYSNKLKKRIIEQSIFILNDIYSVGFLEENYDFKESQNISILNNNRLVKKTAFSSLIKPENLLFYVNNQIILNNYSKKIFGLYFHNLLKFPLFVHLFLSLPSQRLAVCLSMSYFLLLFPF